MYWVLIFVHCLSPEKACTASVYKVFSTERKCMMENEKYLVPGTCVRSHVYIRKEDE